MKAAIYIRTSTNEQTSSINTQLDRLHDYVKKQGWFVYKEYTETISGASKNRKQFNEMLREARLKCFDVILITNLSRFSRGTLVSVLGTLSELEQMDIKVIAIDQNFDTSTAMGRALLGMTVLLSELEREMMAERSKAGYQHAKELGHCMFYPPFGYTTVDKKLVEIPEEAEIVRNIYADRKAGMKLRELKDKYGLTMGRIHYILKNQVYKTGEFYLKDKIYITMKPILEERDTEAVQ